MIGLRNLRCVGIPTDLVLSGSPSKLMQSSFSRARVANFEEVPLAYDNPGVLYTVTHGTTRLLPGESVKVAGVPAGAES